MVTVDSLLKTYEKFATKPRSEVQAAIDAGLQQCALDQWQDRTDAGTALFAAHLLSMDWWESVSLASASTSQAGGKPAQLPTTVSGDINADLDLTHYGRLFKAMRLSVVAMRPHRGAYDAGGLGFSL